MNFLYEFDTDLDLLGRKIVFFKTTGVCSRPAVTMGGTLFTTELVPSRQGLRPTIEVSTGGRTFKAAIDTGAQRSVLFSTAASELGLESASQHGSDGFALRGFGSAAIMSYRHVLDRIDVGDASVLNLPVQVADQPRIGDVDMLLGADFLERVHVWISHSSGMLVIQSPPLISAPIALQP